METTAEKKHSKLEWMFYIIVLPLLFISILSGILMWFLGYDVKTNALQVLNKVPVIEKLIDDKQFEKQTEVTKTVDPIIKLQDTLREKEETIIEYQNMVDKKEKELKLLDQKLSDVLENQLKLKQDQTESLNTNDKDLAKLYSNMNVKSAASILSTLSNDEAVQILSQLNMETKGQIVEKMDPSKAASFTLIEKKQLLEKELSQQKKLADIINIYSSIDDKKVADILSTMKNEDAAMILGQMKDIKITNVMKAIEPTKATELTNLLKQQTYSTDSKIVELNNEIAQIDKEIDKLSASNNDLGSDYQKLASTFTNMNSTLAADTIQSIAIQDKIQAKQILSIMDPVARSKILNEMDPEAVAKLSLDLIN